PAAGGFRPRPLPALRAAAPARVSPPRPPPPPPGGSPGHEDPRPPRPAEDEAVAVAVEGPQRAARRSDPRLLEPEVLRRIERQLGRRGQGDLAAPEPELVGRRLEGEEPRGAGIVEEEGWPVDPQDAGQEVEVHEGMGVIDRLPVPLVDAPQEGGGVDIQALPAAQLDEETPQEAVDARRLIGEDQSRAPEVLGAEACV